MDWLSNHFWQLFGGGGGTAVVAFLIFWLERRHRNKPTRLAIRETSSPVTVRDSQLTGSPIASGSQINQHNYFGPSTPHPATPIPPVAAPAPKNKPRPNMRLTGARVIPVIEPYPGHLVEERNGRTQAAVILFTNEARRAAEGQNVGGWVKALLLYKNGGVEVLRIIGGWMDGQDDSTMFQVDESRKLIVGFLLGKDFIALEMNRLLGDQCRIDPHMIPSFDAVDVRLTHASSGDVLYEGSFRMTIDPLTIVPDITGQGDVTLFRST